MIVGNILSLSPFTTRTGLCTFVSPAGELPCSHLARAVSWAPIVSLDTGASRFCGAFVQAGEECVPGSLAGRGGRKEQEVLRVLALGARILDSGLEYSRSGSRAMVPRGCSAGKDDAADKIRSLLDDHLGDHSAEGVSEQVDRAEPERIEKCHRVGGHRLDAVRGSATRTADTAKVDQDDVVLGGDAVDQGGVPIVEDGREVMQKYHRHPGG